MTKLRPYQEKGVDWLEWFDGVSLLADDMGLGKTIQSLKYVERNNKLPAIVICFASLKWNWEAEIKKHTKMNSIILSGRNPWENLTDLELYEQYDITIINYDILKKWLPVLEKVCYETLIMDEAQAICNGNSKRSSWVHYLSRTIPHRIALSGTPLTNRPPELWHILHVLRPDLYPKYYSFAHTYSHAVHTHWGWQFKGGRNLKQLHKQLRKNLMIRRRKKDVLKDLPKKSRHVVLLNINRARKRDYDLALSDYRNWMIKKGKYIDRRKQHAKELAKLSRIKKLAAMIKLPGVIHWVKNFLEETNEKLILVTWHKDVLYALRNEFEGALTLYGQTPQKQRRDTVEAFQNNKRKRILIFQFKVGGIGLNLTAASNLAFVEMSWTSIDHNQSEDRIHRIGQDQPANCYYLVGKGTIEEKLCVIHREKQRIIDQVVDGTEKQGSLDVYQQLMRLLKKEGSETRS